MAFGSVVAKLHKKSTKKHSSVPVMKNKRKVSLKELRDLTLPKVNNIFKAFPLVNARKSDEV